jgi:23S rRNA (guanosine2251-2'-O)-methyltransferase
MSYLVLKNPHSVLAALEVRPADVFEIRVQHQGAGDTWRRVADRARGAGVTVREAVPAAARPHGRAGKDRRAGGAEAHVKERQGIELAPLFRSDASESGLWLALDQLQDPHNVGAVFRSGAFFGVRGIVMTRDRSAPLSAAVYDVASGGLEYVPFSLQTNLARAIETAKQAGFWVLGTSEHAEKDISQIDRDRRWLLVVGNEERGLRRLTLNCCDEVCRLTPRGPITSLNVSVAAAVMVAQLTGGGESCPMADQCCRPLQT